MKHKVMTEQHIRYDTVTQKCIKYNDMPKGIELHKGDTLEYKLFSTSNGQILVTSIHSKCLFIPFEYDQFVIDLNGYPYHQFKIKIEEVISEMDLVTSDADNFEREDAYEYIILTGNEGEFKFRIKPNSKYTYFRHI